MRSKLKFWSTDKIKDENCPKEFRLQRLEMLEITITTNQKFEKILLAFQRFEAFIAIIP